MSIPSEKELLDAACHLGHRKDKWCPKMEPYLYGSRKGIHIFDLVKTKKHLELLATQMKALQSAGKTILFVSTKQQSIPLVEAIGKALGQPMVTKKWIPGLLTNWSTMRKRIRYYLDLKKSFQTGEVEKYTKKEQVALRKQLAKLEEALSGVADMASLPDAIFIIDGVRDKVAVLEGRKLGIPIYGICDSNADPDYYSVFVPANDDAVKSISIVLTTVQDEMGAASNRKKDREDKERSPVAA
jgi:small subunit ribosomal protein S2